MVAVGVTVVGAPEVGGGGVVVLGGVGGTTVWPNSSTAVGATTVASIPAASSWAATAWATARSSGRSAAAPMTSRTGAPADPPAAGRRRGSSRPR